MLNKAWKTIDSGLEPARLVLLPRLRRFAGSRLNPIVLRAAGRRFSPLGVLYHRGRHSGRLFAAPLRPAARGNTLVFSVTHGTATDWYRNVLAADFVDFKWHGVMLRLEHPRTLDANKSLMAFGPLERGAFRLAGVHTFLALKKVR